MCAPGKSERNVFLEARGLMSQSGGSQLRGYTLVVLTGAAFASQGTFDNVSGHFLMVMNLGRCYWHLVSKKPGMMLNTLHRTAPYDKELFHSKCQ